LELKVKKEINHFDEKPKREVVEGLPYWPALSQRSLDKNTLLSTDGRYPSNK